MCRRRAELRGEPQQHGPAVGVALGAILLQVHAGIAWRNHTTTASDPEVRSKASRLREADWGIARGGVAVAVLRFWNPLSFVRLYNGSYFASFVLIVGVVLLLVHRQSARALEQ